jgi:hypothetical protein
MAFRSIPDRGYLPWYQTATIILSQIFEKYGSNAPLDPIKAFRQDLVEGSGPDIPCRGPACALGDPQDSPHDGGGENADKFIFRQA